jgi:hypothetical protein
MRRNGVAKLGAAALAAALAGCSVVGARSAAEPAYEVVGRVGGTVEIRRYGPRAAAEAVADGGRDAAFGRLFRYISGANRGGAKIAMTAPVATDEPERLAMTAPVATQGMAMRFFLPEGVTAATAPAPTDPTVRIVDLPAQDMAVLRFSGLRTDAAVAARTAELSAALDGSGWAAAGPAEAWFYDPPWTLPPFRRNEIAAPVAPR